MPADSQKTVLILGAGINGAALARELVLNGISVCVIDANDIAWGATSRSSRLIHGGLRYLEYGDFGLVRESLQERTLLRKLAPQFVEPLRLYIPVRHRFAGILRSGFRFLGGTRIPPFQWIANKFHGSSDRGLWLVRLGLWFYDRFAWGGDFPKFTVTTPNAAGVPKVDAQRFRWMCAYTDAQMRFPERFVVAMLDDARQVARERNVGFQLWTYHRAQFDGSTVHVQSSDASISATLAPSLVINATGAWGDLTLQGLHVPSPPLFGGTKGSHLVSSAPRLREALGDNGLYAEAEDGRLVFVLPFGQSVLVGTTDQVFPESPDRAIATPAEIDYLIGMVNHLFPTLDMTRGNIDMHYAGVRPLPKNNAAKAAAISRDHSVEKNSAGPVPIWTLVGGKLTTARAFAENVAKDICHDRGVTHRALSRERPIPGGANYPANAAAVTTECARIANTRALAPEAVRTLWSLWGDRTGGVLSQIEQPQELLAGTRIPLGVVRYVIEHEWATTLGDLVERRLMLLFDESLSRRALRQMAECLVSAGQLAAGGVDSAVDEQIERLQKYYGKSVTE